MKYPVDAEVEGKVVRVSNFGAFVELEPGIEGLVHISDLTWSKKIKNIDDFVKIGDKIKVKVILLDTTDKKLKLSIKSLEKNPWEVINETNSVGSILKGKVVEVKDFGIFVEVEQGVDAFIHISDFSWEKASKDTYKIGDEVEFKVIESKIFDLENLELTRKQAIPLGKHDSRKFTVDISRFEYTEPKEEIELEKMNIFVCL
jgi:ribosomal protein S1